MACRLARLQPALVNVSEHVADLVAARDGAVHSALGIKSAREESMGGEREKGRESSGWWESCPRCTWHQIHPGAACVGRERST